jgi:hypothetical protein
VENLYLVVRVKTAKTDAPALARLRQYFDSRTANGLRPWRSFAVNDYVGHGTRDFSVITMGPLDEYLADDRSLPLALLDRFRALARQYPGQLVLIEMGP